MLLFCTFLCSQCIMRSLGPLVFLLQKTFRSNYLTFQSLDFELMKVIECTWWRLSSVPDEGYWVYLMKVIECTWWRLLSVPGEGYWGYLMKVIECTWWRLLSIPDEGYWVYLMKVIECTWWRLLSIPDEGYSRNVLYALNKFLRFYLYISLLVK